MSVLPILHLRPVLWLCGLVVAVLASGCATSTRTTTTLETTMHSPDSTFRLQSSDLTARVQIEITR
jgi:hypothetical protein